MLEIFLYKRNPCAYISCKQVRNSKKKRELCAKSVENHQEKAVETAKESKMLFKERAAWRERATIVCSTEVQATESSCEQRVSSGSATQEEE